MPDGPRFLTLSDVAEILNTSLAQVTALVRRGELRALKLGGRGQWRIEVSELEAFIERMYVETQRHIKPEPGQSTTPDAPAHRVDSANDTARPAPAQRS